MPHGVPYSEVSGYLMCDTCLSFTSKLTLLPPPPLSLFLCAGQVNKTRRAKVSFSYAAENTDELSLMPGQVSRNLWPIRETLIHYCVYVHATTCNYHTYICTFHKPNVGILCEQSVIVKIRGSSLYIPVTSVA